MSVHSANMSQLRQKLSSTSAPQRQQLDQDLRSLNPNDQSALTALKQQTGISQTADLLALRDAVLTQGLEKVLAGDSQAHRNTTGAQGVQFVAHDSTTQAKTGLLGLLNATSANAVNAAKDPIGTRFSDYQRALSSIAGFQNATLVNKDGTEKLSTNTLVETPSAEGGVQQQRLGDIQIPEANYAGPDNVALLDRLKLSGATLGALRNVEKVNVADSGEAEQKNTTLWADNGLWSPKAGKIKEAVGDMMANPKNYAMLPERMGNMVFAAATTGMADKNLEKSYPGYKGTPQNSGMRIAYYPYGGQRMPVGDGLDLMLPKFKLEGKVKDPQDTLKQLVAGDEMQLKYGGISFTKGPQRVFYKGVNPDTGKAEFWSPENGPMDLEKFQKEFKGYEFDAFWRLDARATEGRDTLRVLNGASGFNSPSQYATDWDN